MESLLNDDENKKMFLKAVILGINYGKSNRANYYLDNLERELSKLDKSDKSKQQISVNPINPKIKNLENQRNNIINIIKNLIIQNYAYNYPKIIYLKNAVAMIEKEIIKEKAKEPLKDTLRKPSKENLVDELEKTLGNLSNLFVR
jgi:hypothetical protein